MFCLEDIFLELQFGRIQRNRKTNKARRRIQNFFFKLAKEK